MRVLGFALLALLIVDIVLEHLGAGIVVVTVVLVIAVVGWALGGLFWGRSRRRTRGRVDDAEAPSGFEHPEFLGPGGPEDPDQAVPAAGIDSEPTVQSRR